MESLYIPAYCEDLHGRIMIEFHSYRKENNLEPDIVIDGIILSKIIAKAKTGLYRDRPDAENAGYKKDGNDGNNINK